LDNLTVSNYNILMKEYLTEAVVLNFEKSQEANRRVSFYTKELGLLNAQVISGRKITSKLSLHLNPLNLVLLRLVEKKRMIVADAVVLNAFSNIRGSALKIKKALGLTRLIRTQVLTKQPDLKIWYHLINSLKTGEIDYKIFLKILGYDPKLSRCQNCSIGQPAYFCLIDQTFICEKCHFKFPENELLYIKSAF